MRKVREVLRLKSLGRTVREIAAGTDLASSTVGDYLRRAKVAGLGWPLPADLDDAALEDALFIPRDGQRRGRPLPDWGQVHTELQRKHMTLALLWEEYKAEHPDGLQYSQFCDHYRHFTRTLHIWMRQEHRAGEKLFVDYAGDGIRWVNPITGEEHTAWLFVAVLGASSITFARATVTQQLHDWIDCHVKALAFLGGAPRVFVPDQTRTAVKQTCRYDPVPNPTYRDLASHYNVCIIPARPRRPKDKAKVEAGVLLAERWIIAALRNRTFFSLDEINEAIRPLIEKLNNRPLRKVHRSRRELFVDIDQPALQQLPDAPYEFAEWKIGARVNLDYHIEFEKNYYSVPFQYAREQVDIRATVRTVEIFHRARRIASHALLPGMRKYSTVVEHMPRAHREHAGLSPTRLIEWAGKVGPSSAKLVERILADRPHPEQGYRACLGIQRLAKRYTEERLERAAARALACKAHSYRSVESILKHHLDDQPLPSRPIGALPAHENVRGSRYYASL
jgi:transposase